jgi:hypothetical protein
MNWRSSTFGAIAEAERSPSSFGRARLVARPQRLSAHQTFDLVQAARKACFQHVAPDPTRAISAVACHEARLDRRHDRFILP